MLTGSKPALSDHLYRGPVPREGVHLLRVVSRHPDATAGAKRETEHALAVDGPAVVRARNVMKADRRSCALRPARARR